MPASGSGWPSSSTASPDTIDAITQCKLQVTGDKVKLGELFLMFDKFEFWFNIVTP